MYCSPLNREDLHTLKIIGDLNTYLTQDGATTKPYRCTSMKNFGTHSSGRPWWRRVGLLLNKQLGYPLLGLRKLGGTTTWAPAAARAATISAPDRWLRTPTTPTSMFRFTAMASRAIATGHARAALKLTMMLQPNTPLQVISQTLANNINNGIMAAVTGNASPLGPATALA